MPSKTLIRALPPSARTRLQELVRIARCHLGSRAGRTLPSIVDYFRAQPIGGYLGWVGHDNVGDEVIHRAIGELLAPLPLVLYPDIPFELLLHAHLVGRGKLLDVVVLGGGTLINTVGYLPRFQQALREGMRAVVFGSGVRDPAFWTRREPGSEYDGRLLEDWIAALNQASMVTVRGPLSADTLERHGLSRPPVIGDPALSACRPRLPRPRSGVIGLNLGTHDPIWGRQDAVEREIRIACRELVGRGLRIDFIPMNASDETIGRALANDLGSGATVFDGYRDTARTIERLGSCDVVIGQRLHSVVLAAGSSVPSISLSYNPKCEDFMASIEMSRFVVRTDAVRHGTLLDLVREIEGDHDAITRQLTRVCDAYRHAQRMCARSITESLG